MRRLFIISCALAAILQPTAAAATAPYISVSARTVAQYAVEFTVTTNIPLPVEVMASVSLKGQKDDDVYIGVTERVKLTTQKQVFIVDPARSKKVLPTGMYVAEVSFYPRWGAKKGNPRASEIKQEIVGSDEVFLGGSGEPAAIAARRENLRKWVMLNVAVGDPWSPVKFRGKLGEYKSLGSTRSRQTSYYFMQADVTIVVNSFTNTIVTWNLGRGATAKASLQ